ncbi:MAG: lysylphosphatidylglycerol synthase transmembrane domain-containing protein [Humibacter sp.]
MSKPAGIVAQRLRAIVRSRRFHTWARPAAGALVLAAVVWRVGAAPFVQGVLSIDLRALAAALVLCALSTAALAWRWRIIANRLGARITFPRAIGMYYRSQFLNTVLPGGVLGDVHRAVAHGRDAGDLPQASRAVAIERVAGQLVQSSLTVVVLLVVGSEFAGWAFVALGIGLAALVVAIVVVVASRSLRRIVARELAELRVGIGSAKVLLQVIATSVVSLACHVALFAVAVAAVGEQLPPVRSVAVALVVLLGSAIPVNIGGWGPREGVAGWVFAMAGLGADAGVAASTTFGVLAMIALASGAVIALVSAMRSGRRPAADAPSSAVSSQEGLRHAPVPALAAPSHSRGGRSS